MLEPQVKRAVREGLRKLRRRRVTADESEQMATMFARGRTPKDISEHFGCSLFTVHNHLRRQAFKKGKR